MKVTHDEFLCRSGLRYNLLLGSTPRNIVGRVKFHSKKWEQYQVNRISVPEKRVVFAFPTAKNNNDCRIPKQAVKYQLHVRTFLFAWLMNISGLLAP